MNLNLVQISTIVKKEGVRGFFAGYGAFLLRDLPFDAVEFAAYEALKSVYTRYTKRNLNAVESAATGAIAGGITGTSHPFSQSYLFQVWWRLLLMFWRRGWWRKGPPVVMQTSLTPLERSLVKKVHLRSSKDGKHDYCGSQLEVVSSSLHWSKQEMSSFRQSSNKKPKPLHKNNVHF